MGRFIDVVFHPTWGDCGSGGIRILPVIGLGLILVPCEGVTATSVNVDL